MQTNALTEDPLKRVAPHRSKLSKELKEFFKPYFSLIHALDLPAMVKYDIDVFHIITKVDPELLEAPWQTMSFEEAKVEWMPRVSKLKVAYWEFTQKFLSWDIPYVEICKLPKQEYAKKVLANESEILHAIVDIEVLEVMAGYKKQPLKRVGNVIYLGN